MLSEGLVATPKVPAVYVKNPWDQKDFVAGGFWVDEFVGIGFRKELEALKNGVDAKYGITGLGEVGWVPGMLIARHARFRFRKGSASIRS
jgi:hypothetical protein